MRSTAVLKVLERRAAPHCIALQVLLQVSDIMVRPRMSLLVICLAQCVIFVKKQPNPILVSFGVAQRKRGGPITLRSLDRNQAPKTNILQPLLTGSHVLPPAHVHIERTVNWHLNCQASPRLETRIPGSTCSDLVILCISMHASINELQNLSETQTLLMAST